MYKCTHIHAHAHVHILVYTHTHTHTRTHTDSFSPSADDALLHKPSQPSLGEDSVLEVQSAVLVDVRFSEFKVRTEPGVLGITIVVLCRTKGMGHALQAVHYGAGEVVDGVDPVI